MLGRCGMGKMSFWYPKTWNGCTKWTVFLLIYRQSYLSLDVTYMSTYIHIHIYIYDDMYKYTICKYVRRSRRIWKGHHHLAPNHVPILVSLGNAGERALCFCCQSCKALRSNSEIDDNQKDSDISIQCWGCWSLKDTQVVFQQKDVLEESNISQIWDILWLVGQY